MKESKNIANMFKRAMTILLAACMVAGTLPAMGPIAEYAEAAEVGTEERLSGYGTYDYFIEKYPSMTSLATAASGASVKTLATGVYYVPEGETAYYNCDSASTSTANSSTSGLVINGSVKIVLLNGSKLYARGGNASGQSTVGKAGIYLPSDKSLTLEGTGELYAYGGRAASGGPGSTGGNAAYCNNGKLTASPSYGYSSSSGEDCRAGDGGGGGYGGAGGGAGIGTNGGGGGGGASSRSSHGWIKRVNVGSEFNRDGNSGNTGGSGSSSASTGTLYVKGSVKVTAYGGSIGSSVGSGGGGGDYAFAKWEKCYAVGGGGGGGGGGAGYAGNGIGSGGGGAGGGGSGGSGGYRFDKNYLYAEGAGGGYGGTGAATGYGGTGGRSYNDGSSFYAGTGSGTQIGNWWGGSGGSGGGGGSYGTSTAMYLTSSSNVSGSGASRYTIYPADECYIEITDTPTSKDGKSWKWTNSAIEPTISVIHKLTGTTLDTRGYTVSYTNNVAAGTATINVAGKSGVSSSYGILGTDAMGTSTSTLLTATFDIKYNLDDMKVVYNDKLSNSYANANYPAYAHTGEALVKGTLETTTGIVVPSEDYTRSCTNNINVGVAKTTISPSTDAQDKWDQNNIATSQTGNFYILERLKITTPSETFYDIAKGVSYSKQLTATSNNPSPYNSNTSAYRKWTVVSGNIPSGLTLNSGTGLISGTPNSVNSATATIKVTNAIGDSSTETYTWKFGDIFGTVTDRNGNKVSGVKVHIYDYTSNEEIGNYVTGDNGMYSVVILTPTFPSKVRVKADGGVDSSERPYKVYSINGSTSNAANGAAISLTQGTPSTCDIVVEKAVKTTFDAGSKGSTDHGVQYGYAGTSIKTPTVTRNTEGQGWEFKGWSTTSGATTADSPTVYPSSDTEYYAVYNEKTYNVKYADTGETAVSDKTVKYGDSGLLPTAALTKTGYNFSKWVVEGTDTQVTSSTKYSDIAADTTTGVTLKALWEAKEVTLTLNAEGCELGQQVIKGTYNDVVKYKIPTKDGYIFNGWNLGDGTIEYFISFPDADATYTAEFIRNQILVAFNPMGGDFPNGETGIKMGDYGDSYTLPKPPTKEGYVFAGWYTTYACEEEMPTDLKIPAESVTYYAKWEPKDITLTLNENYVAEGQTQAKTVTITGKYGETVAYVMPARDGFAFNGWKFAEDAVDSSAIMSIVYPASNTTYYATWVEGKSVVLYNPMGGKLADKDGDGKFEGVTGETYTKPDNPTKEGYIFEGWFTEPNGEGTEYTGNTFPVAANTTYYAKWEPKTVNVILNGGTGSDPASQLKEGKTGETVEYIIPVYAGHTFQGWKKSDEEDDASAVKSLIFPEKATTYTAVWKADDITVTFNAELNGGEIKEADQGLKSQTGATGGIFTLPEVVEKEGYIFDGWFTLPKGGTKLTQTKFGTQSVTYYAQWSPKKITVTLAATGSDRPLQTLTGDYGEMIVYTMPAKTDSAFKGWKVKDADDSTAKIFLSYPKENTEYEAVFVQGVAIVAFDPNGGKMTGTQVFQVNADETYDVPADPSKDGYIFKSWNTKPQGGGAEPEKDVNTGKFKYPGAGNTMYYAQWEAKEIKVKLNYNYGIDAADIAAQPEPVRMVGEAGKTIEYDMPIREGYAFKGWKLDGETDDMATMFPVYPTAEMTEMYAVWAAGEVTVTYDAMGGKFAEGINNVITGKTGVTMSEPVAPTKAGFKFAGWYTTTTGGEKAPTLTKLPSENVTYYAQWTPQGLTVEVTGTAVYDGTPQKPAIEVKATASEGDVTTLTADEYVAVYTLNTNAGENTALVTVYGMGEYAGLEGSKNFSIAKAEQTVTFEKGVTGLTAPVGTKFINPAKAVDEFNKPTGSQIVYSITTGSDVADIDITTGELTFKKVGTVTVKAETVEATNYNEAESQYSVEAKETAFTVDDVDDQLHTGKEVRPALTVKDTETQEVLKENVHYTLTYTNNIEIGTASVTITGIGAYNGVVETATFQIVKGNKDFKITLDPKEFIYNGEAQKPTSITVKYGEDKDKDQKTLEEGRDYRVIYPDNPVEYTNAGTVVITVEGVENTDYEGKSSIAYYTIKPKELTEEMAPVEIPSQQYTGAEIKPAITLTDGDTTLEHGVDYSIRYENNINKSEEDSPAKMTITGQGNYKGTIEITFVIENNGSFKVADNATVEYDGQPHSPNVVVYVGTRKLTENVDYKVYDGDGTGEEAENIEKTSVGSYTVTIKGIGAYEKSTNIDGSINYGDVTAQWSIVKSAQEVSLKDADDPSDTPAQAINLSYGETKQLEAIFKKPEEAGVPTAQLLYSSSNPKVVAVTADGKITAISNGTAVITVIAKETKNYKAAEGRITVQTAPKTDVSLTIQDIPDQYYTGSPIMPAVIVKDGDLQLTENVHYTLSFENNTGITSADSPAKVTATGIGDYEGVDFAEAAFNIIAPENDFNVVLSTEKHVYNGAPQTFESVIVGFMNEGELKNLTENVDYTLDYQNNFDAGNATLWIKGIDGPDYQNKKSVFVFKIERKPITEDMVSDIADQKVQEGGATIRPDVTVSDDGSDLIVNTDYNLVYGDNNAEGTGVVAVYGQGNYQGQVNKTFNITDKQITVTLDLNYGDDSEPANVVLTGKMGATVNYWPEDREGYVFKGWAASETATTGEFSLLYPAQDATYYAVWEAGAVTVRFSANGGNYAADEDGVRSGQANGPLTAPTSNKLRKPDHAFLGWFTEPDGGEELKGTALETFPTKSVTYYAQWAPIGQKRFTATIEKDSVTNNGKVQTPFLYVKDSKTDATVARSKYDVKYTNNKGEVVTQLKDTGVYRIVITGKDDYKGSEVILGFAITPAASGGGGGSVAQRPDISTDNTVSYKLDSTGTTATFTPVKGYAISEVTVNGVSKGAVTTVSGLKTGDKVVVTTIKVSEEDPTEPTDPTVPTTDAERVEAVKKIKWVARSAKAVSPKGKKCIKIWYYDKYGSKLVFDGVEIWRSTKRYSGYGKKPLFVTTKNVYYNTSVKPGKYYYYKVRGFVVTADGKKHYTKWSLKAYRQAPR